MAAKTFSFFRREDTRSWLIMNIFIVVLVPLGVMFIGYVAERPITFSSAMVDSSLIAFTVIFNIGSFIVDEMPSEQPPKVSAPQVQIGLAKRMIESIIENSNEEHPDNLKRDVNKNLRGIFKKCFDTYSLTEIQQNIKVKSQKQIDKASERQEENKRIKNNSIIVFFLAAVCMGLYATYASAKELERFHLFILIIVTIILLVFSVRLGINTLVIVEKRKKHERGED